jgi:hypothetical protein
MKGIKRNLFVLILVSVLSGIFFSTIALAQTDININNSNIIRMGGDVAVAPRQTVENAHAIGGDVTIGEGARVTKTAIAIDGDVILEKNARVDGDVYAVGGEIITEQGATIGGASGTALDNGRWGTYGHRRRGIGNFFRYIFHTGFHIFNVAVVAILGVLLLLWRPNFLLNLAATVREYPLQCGLWGLGGLFAAILLIIFLAISLIGIPLLPLVGLGVTVAVILGNLGVALWVGQRIFTGKERTTMQEFLIGMLILGLIGLIPVLGGLVLSMVNIFGLGALITWLWNRRRTLTAV